MRKQQPLCEKYYKRLMNAHERFIHESGNRIIREVHDQGQQLVRLVQKVREFIEIVAREIARKVRNE